ncbi:MAG: NHL repeat-containing protein [bacterium]|nr:NHL repeat-containing protein [bacterium]
MLVASEIVILFSYYIVFVFSGRKYLNRAEIFRSLKSMGLALMLMLTFGSVAAVELAVPAEFSYEVRIPGKFDQIKRPASVFYDHELDELFVADAGNNRIVIFDKNGNFIFEFSGTSHFSSPSEVTVDENGLIWVLASSQTGRHISVFDFDGLFLREIELPGELDGQLTRFSSFDLDRDRNIYLIERYSAQIIVLDSLGNFKTKFGILKDYTPKEREEEFIGRIRVQNGLLLIPCGNSGVVYLYSTGGNLVSAVGYKGNSVGSLSFPVSAIMVNDSLVLVLDKHRHNVVCFDREGKFIGEFGGRGITPGWFYHPTLLEVGIGNSVYIGQIFNGKVQACRIPEFICPSEAGGKKE